MKMSIDGNVTREEFYVHLNKLLQNKTAPNAFVLTTGLYERILKQVKEATTKQKRTASDYRRLKRYQILPTPEGEKLFHKGSCTTSSPQVYVTMDEVYDIIHEHHLKLHHCGKNRLVTATKLKYRNVTAEFIILYLSLCKNCKEKKRRKNSLTKQDSERKLEFKECEVGSSLEIATENTLLPTSFQDVTEDFDMEQDLEEEKKIYPELFSRGQIDILDVTTVPHEAYKYLMVYRNLVTKFIHLKPLKATSVDESVDALLEIFLVFGAPNVLQSKNGLSVTKQICKRIYMVCPEIKIVCARVPSENSKERSNKDILKLLKDFLKENTSMKWYQAAKFIQNVLNTSFDTTIFRSPNEATFGSNPKPGLSSVLSKNEYDQLQTEDDLVAALDERDSGNTSDQIMLQESLIPASSIIKIENITDEDNDDENFEDDSSS